MLNVRLHVLNSSDRFQRWVEEEKERMRQLPEGIR